MDIQIEKKIQQWNKDGYIYIPAALNKIEIEESLDSIDKLEKCFRQKHNIQLNTFYNERNIVHKDHYFMKYIDHPVILPYLIELMGYDIQLIQSAIIVRPSKVNDEGFFHTDGGRSLSQLPINRGTKRPIQLRTIFFLTDIDDEDSGNFCVIPGTQYTPFPENYILPEEYKEKVIQLKPKKGDAILFPHSLWHGATRNNSHRSRKIMVYGYGPLCMRPFDYISADTLLLSKGSDRQRRMLGDIGPLSDNRTEFKIDAGDIQHTIIGDKNPYSYYYPENQEQIMKIE